ncbi:uncharacterized protein EV420DRAFT_1479144 [Desarmillaria tabescens]|uniref:Uncharacterized protein n=1 Tax=Armillaria tabescens TaxID=1929756 RepID=A0AA39N6D4_ARMTA|nr:uncharacterized protein EV420DRAFT_1479144 [Desarmillaria tabescens]KAK0459108.1 hypothetical protein EV420DRAFT_1479144 [Desarmillaria tabescens]
MTEQTLSSKYRIYRTRCRVVSTSTTTTSTTTRSSLVEAACLMAPLGAQATNTTRSRTRGKPLSTKNPPRQQTNQSPGDENRPAGESKGKLRVPTKRPVTGTTEDAVRTKKPKKTTTSAPVPLEDMTQSASSNATFQFLDPYAQVPEQ